MKLNPCMPITVLISESKAMVEMLLTLLTGILSAVFLLEDDLPLE